LLVGLGPEGGFSLGRFSLLEFGAEVALLRRTSVESAKGSLARSKLGAGKVKFFSREAGTQPAGGGDGGV
jgi:hypothetical protein